MTALRACEDHHSCAAFYGLPDIRFDLDPVTALTDVRDYKHTNYLFDDFLPK
jgi:hypothetical protein